MKKTLLTALVILAVSGISSAAFAQPVEPTTRPATTRPAQTPVLADNTVLKADVPYGSDDLQKLDIYSPKGATGAPIVLFIHGGEWSRGDKLAISSKPKYFNEHSIVFVSTNYRLSPKAVHPAQVDDVAAAIAYVHDHAAEFGGDPNKIVIMGHSAGCHLVSLVSLNPSSLEKVRLKPDVIRGTIAWSGGMYDLVARAKGEGMYPPFIKATFGDDEAAQRAGSPMTYATNAKDAPPFLYCSVDDDRSQSSRDATAAMVKAIQDAGGKAQSELLVGKTHFTANHEFGAEGDKSCEIAMKFIESVTK